MLKNLKKKVSVSAKKISALIISILVLLSVITIPKLNLSFGRTLSLLLTFSESSQKSLKFGIFISAIKLIPIRMKSMLDFLAFFQRM